MNMMMNSKERQTELSLRQEDRLGRLFFPTENQRSPAILLDNGPMIVTSSDDLGVQLNGGRRGSCWGPEAIINVLKNLAIPKTCQSKTFLHHLKWNCREFEQRQEESTEQWYQVISNWNLFEKKHWPLIHLGGGHDHIFPLLHALQKGPQKRTVVINIDPHLDTRTDKHPHSGTPFRQAAEVISKDKEFLLLQIGTTLFANPASNYQAIGKQKMALFPYTDFCNKGIEGLAVFLEEQNFKSDDLIILSIDLDVIDSSEMKGVSAVNPSGLSVAQVGQITKMLHKYWARSLYSPIVGCYEFNPLYDDISATGAKKVASLLYPLLVFGVGD